MKNFITLHRIDGKFAEGEVIVRISSIISVRAEDEESTWIELSNGNMFLVTELVSDIMEVIG